MPPSSDTPPPRASLLGLPTELRLKIYACIFTSGRAASGTASTKTPTTLIAEPQVLRTCRRIYQEAFAAAYESVELKIRIQYEDTTDFPYYAFEWPTPRSSVPAVPAYAKGLVKHVTIAGDMMNIVLQINQPGVSGTLYPLEAAAQVIGQHLLEVDSITILFTLQSKALPASETLQDAFEPLLLFPKLRRVAVRPGHGETDTWSSAAKNGVMTILLERSKVLIEAVEIVD